MTGRQENHDMKDFSLIRPKSSNPIRSFFPFSNVSNFNRLEQDGWSHKEALLKPRKIRFLLCCFSSSCIATNPVKIRRKSGKRVTEMDQMDKIRDDIEEFAELENAVDDFSCFSSSPEEACKEFRKYLIKMVVEEKDAKDLMDVEELLRCFRNLRSPIYKGLIGRFYVELCVDIFCSSSVDDISSQSTSMTSV